MKNLDCFVTQCSCDNSYDCQAPGFDASLDEVILQKQIALLSGIELH